MRRYPTHQQFSEHVCTHWEMLEEGEGCVLFHKLWTDPTLHCNRKCPGYDPWDCSREELLEEALPHAGKHQKGGIPMATCKTCGADIKWIRTVKNQQMMPVDVPAITVVTTLGHVIKAYTPHWASCPGADDHRKRPSRHTDDDERKEES